MIPALLAAVTMTLVSPDFKAGGVIPTVEMSAPCGGKNRVPSLTWAKVPPSTKSFALIEHDPDAPIPGGFYHWVVYDVPAGTRALGGASSVGVAGLASAGRNAYYGPCPPAGPAHHYVFTLYALDVERLGGGAPLTGPQVEARLTGHVIGRATLDTMAARPCPAELDC